MLNHFGVKAARGRQQIASAQIKCRTSWTALSNVSESLRRWLPRW